MKNFSIILGAIILALFVTLVIWGVYCDNTIAITNYCVNNTKNDAKLKFVVITDLHNKEYGEKNADLAELVKEKIPILLQFAEIWSTVAIPTQQR